MASRTAIIGVIEALCELVRIEKQRQVFKQEINHANALFLEAVKNKDDMIEFLQELTGLKMANKISEEAERRILVQIGCLLRDQVSFDEACEQILARVT
ncbi:MAG: hypothetical protein ACLP5H_32975 [Desulfomonilaceae bacterium]